jgi:hypothetical protein
MIVNGQEIDMTGTFNEWNNPIDYRLTEAGNAEGEEMAKKSQSDAQKEKAKVQPRKGGQFARSPVKGTANPLPEERCTIPGCNKNHSVHNTTIGD